MFSNQVQNFWKPILELIIWNPEFPISNSEFSVSKSEFLISISKLLQYLLKTVCLNVVALTAQKNAPFILAMNNQF